MTRTRSAVVVEFAASVSWDAVAVLLGIQHVDPNKMTRRYLKAFRKGDSAGAERMAWALQAQSILLRLRQDPRRVGYPIQSLMRSLCRLAELSGFPSPEALAAIHAAIGPRVRGTAYGVGWPERSEDWGRVEASDCEPIVYRKIRRDIYDQTATETPGPAGVDG